MLVYDPVYIHIGRGSWWLGGTAVSRPGEPAADPRTIYRYQDLLVDLNQTQHALHHNTIILTQANDAGQDDWARNPNSDAQHWISLPIPPTTCMTFACLVE